MLKPLGVLDGLALCVLATLLSVGGCIFLDPSLGWRIKLGELIVDKRQIPQSDPFVYGGQKLWLATEWLFDLFIHLVYLAGGWPLLQVLVVAIVFISLFCVVVPNIKAESETFISAFLISLLLVLTCSNSISLSPNLFSLLYFSITYVVCRNFINKESYSVISLFALPGLFVAWANTNSMFFLGLVVLVAGLVHIGVYWEGSRLNGYLRLGSISVLCLCATLVNPYGGRLYHRIFAEVNSKYAEMFDVSLRASTDSYSFYLVLALCLLSLVLKSRKEWTIFEIIVLIVAATFSFYQRRYIPFFAIAACVPLSRAVNVYYDSWRMSGFKFVNIRTAFDRLTVRERTATNSRYAAILLIVSLVSVIRFGNIPFRAIDDSSPDVIYPRGAVEFIRSDMLEARKNASMYEESLFHSPWFGGYLTLELFPKLLPTIDDRVWLHGEDAFIANEITMAAKPGWRTEMLNYSMALVPNSSNLSNELSKSSSWKKAYTDSINSIYKKIAEQ